jgi:hypothetical protein
MENMLKYDFMKYRHHLLYYRVPPIYIRYMPNPVKALNVPFLLQNPQ